MPLYSKSVYGGNAEKTSKHLFQADFMRSANFAVITKRTERNIDTASSGFLNDTFYDFFFTPKLLFYCALTRACSSVRNKSHQYDSPRTYFSMNRQNLLST